MNNNSAIHIYYDLNIVNNNQDTKNGPPQLVFNDIRNSAILQNPSDYFLSVIRFTLQTANSLPIWIPEIDVSDNLDSDKTIYSFTLKYKTFTSEQRYVYYAPENNLSPPPMPIIYHIITFQILIMLLKCLMVHYLLHLLICMLKF